MLHIDTAGLRSRPGESAHINLESELPPLEYLGEKNVFAGPLTVSVNVINTGEVFHVEGSITGGLQFNCSRCLEPFVYTFTVPLSEIYYPAVEGKRGAGEDAVPFKGDIIDLAPEVRKSILMEMPMKLVCRQECRGLCRQCGCNLNESNCKCADIESSHPRLAALEKLLNNK